MRTTTKLSGSTSNRQASTQNSQPAQAAPPLVTTMGTQINAGLTLEDLQHIVSPLPAYLAAISHPLMLETKPIAELYDPRKSESRFRVCYRLNPKHFTGADTSLDEALVALVRASFDGRYDVEHPLWATAEYVYEAGYPTLSVWSALVISAKRTATRLECAQHVKRMLSFLLNSNTRLINAAERAELGRVPTRVAG